ELLLFQQPVGCFRQAPAAAEPVGEPGVPPAQSFTILRDVGRSVERSPPAPRSVPVSDQGIVVVPQDPPGVAKVIPGIRQADQVADLSRRLAYETLIELPGSFEGLHRLGKGTFPTQGDSHSIAEECDLDTIVEMLWGSPSEMGNE